VTATDPNAATTGETTRARLDAAAALRRLGNALVSHQPDDAVLADLATQIGALLPAVESAPARTHAFLAHGIDFFSARLRGEDDVIGPQQSVFPDCIVSGKANPMGMEADLSMDGNEVVMRVTLGAAFEGAPERAHGGVVAALLDETMGLVLSIAGSPAFTGRLSVAYRAPTPIGVPLEARARLDRRSARKLTITSELRSGDTLLAEGEGLFITVDPTHFLGSA
jgi:acyl-coenzyme A thioesterase PaaI-like protein